MRIRVLLGLGCLLGSLVSCATGGKFAGAGGGNDGGSDGGTAGSAGSGNGGQSSTTTTTTTGSGGGTTTTTTPEVCADSPCKLVSPQCGCPDGDMCALNNMGERECHAAGASQVGEECTGLFSCAPGALCTQASTSTLICSRYCDSDAQCDGGLCLLTLTNAGQEIPDVTLCSDDCDPVGNAGCPAGLGLGCQIYQLQSGAMTVFALCAGAGAGAQGAPCVDNEDCSPGSACFTVGQAPNTVNQCLQWCKPPNGACPGATACQSFPTPLLFNGVEYGACL